MLFDYSLENYQSILTQVAKWRVIPLNNLRDLTDYQGCKQSFYRLIRRLEDRGLVRTIIINGGFKVVTLSNELGKIPYYQNAILHDESVPHEALVSIICNEILTWEMFQSVSLPHEIQDASYDSGISRLPDAVIKGVNKDNKFIMALEVEISRKSKERVQNKIEDYINNTVFDYIFYLFNDIGTFKSYQNFIFEVINSSSYKNSKKNHQARFLLGHKEKMINSNCRLEDIEIYYLGKITNLESIFGKRRVVR